MNTSLHIYIIDIQGSSCVASSCWERRYCRTNYIETSADLYCDVASLSLTCPHNSRACGMILLLSNVYFESNRYSIYIIIGYIKAQASSVRWSNTVYTALHFPGFFTSKKTCLLNICTGLRRHMARWVMRQVQAEETSGSPLTRRARYIVLISREQTLHCVLDQKRTGFESRITGSLIRG